MSEIKKSNMTLEINAAGIRKPINEPYPSKQLLEMACELDIPITFSSDAHSVEQVGFMYDEVKKLAKEIGFTKAALYRNRERELVSF